MLFLSLACAINKEGDVLKSKPQSIHTQSIQSDENQEDNEEKEETVDQKQIKHPQNVEIILPALISRHPTPCNDIPISVIDELVYIMEHIEKPPWTAMRSAQCILELYPEQGMPYFEEWIANPSKQGLAHLIALHLPKISDEILNELLPQFDVSPHKNNLKSILLNQKETIQYRLNEENQQMYEDWSK